MSRAEPKWLREQFAEEAKKYYRYIQTFNFRITMDYSVEFLTLPYIRRPLRSDDLANFDRVKVLNIAHNVYLDDDCAGHFACMKSLKAFYISPSCTMYYEKDGVLYAKAKDCQTTCQMNWIENLADDDEVLIEVPPAYSGDSFLVPEGVKAIANGAFEGTNFKKIVLPESLEIVGFYALNSVKDLELLYVPNKYIKIYDHCTYDYPIKFESSKGGDLKEDIVSNWALWLNPIDRIESVPVVEETIGKDWISCYIGYPRKYVYPLKEMEDVIGSLTSKESILSNLESLDEKFSKHAEFMRAMIFLHTEASLLHCTSKDDANRVIKAIWGDAQSAQASVLDYIDLSSVEKRETWPDDISSEEFLDIAYSCFSFEEESTSSPELIFPPVNDPNNELFIIAQLATSAPMLFLDYLGNTFIRQEVLIPEAVKILKKMADEGDEYAAMNLLCASDEYRGLVDEVCEKYIQMAISKGDIIALFDRCEKYLHSLNRVTFEITEAQKKHIEILVEACLSDDTFTEVTYEWAVSGIKNRVKNSDKWVKLHFVIKDAIPQKAAPKEIKTPKKCTTSPKNKSSISESFTHKTKRISADDDSQQLNLFGNIE